MGEEKNCYDPTFFAYLILAVLDKIRLSEVGMKLDLVHCRLDLCSIPDLLDLRNREVGDTDGLELALLHESLHGLPGLDQGHVDQVHSEGLVKREPLSVVDPSKRDRPMNLRYISSAFGCLTLDDAKYLWVLTR